MRCPKCNSSDTGKRSIKRRTVIDIGGRIPCEIIVMHCHMCGLFFNHDSQQNLMPKGSRYTWGVIDEASDLFDKGCTLTETARLLSQKCGVHIAQSVVFDWRKRYEVAVCAEV